MCLLGAMIFGPLVRGCGCFDVVVVLCVPLVCVEIISLVLTLTILSTKSCVSYVDLVFVFGAFKLY